MRLAAHQSTVLVSIERESSDFRSFPGQESADCLKLGTLLVELGDGSGYEQFRHEAIAAIERSAASGERVKL